jgi:hypothetical protein
MPKIDTDRMRIIDLEFPRTAGMPEFPTHEPAYAFTLYLRHGDSLAAAGSAAAPSGSSTAPSTRVRTSTRLVIRRNAWLCTVA